MTTAIDWDTPAVANNGVTNTALIVQRAGERPVHVSVPPGSTPREFAEILHGFDGYTVDGFGYTPDVEHPGDCVMCANAESGKHNYEAPNA